MLRRRHGPSKFLHAGRHCAASTAGQAPKGETIRMMCLLNSTARSARQCALEAAGCWPGEDDMQWWQFGTATEAALRTFQVGGASHTSRSTAGRGCSAPWTGMACCLTVHTQIALERAGQQYASILPRVRCSLLEPFLQALNGLPGTGRVQQQYAGLPVYILTGQSVLVPIPRR